MHKKEWDNKMVCQMCLKIAVIIMTYMKHLSQNGCVWNSMLAYCLSCFAILSLCTVHSMQLFCMH